MAFGFQYGHRVEFNTHNWVIFRNFINLSFSYMTFVIKENFDKLGFVLNDFIFDPEGYDYILKRNSIFHEGTLVTQEHDKLKFILENYAQIDPTLLESLHYKNAKGDIPLHMAVAEKNNRMVNLILYYMSKIDYAAVGHIKNIFDKLVTYQGFDEYIVEAPFQTIQMQAKQSIII